ncbi:MAG: hypothetical protein WAN73_09395, partial [Methyloceanibacter sp.]
ATLCSTARISPVPSSWARDLRVRTSLSPATSPRTRKSLGDDFTLLPQHLELPVFWTKASDAEPQLDDDRPAHVPNVTARSRGGTMSWLVGGGPPVPAVPKLK